MDLVVVFLLLCLIAWMRKLARIRPIGPVDPVGQPIQRVMTASQAWA